MTFKCSCKSVYVPKIEYKTEAENMLWCNYGSVDTELESNHIISLVGCLWLKDTKTVHKNN